MPGSNLTSIGNGASLDHINNKDIHLSLSEREILNEGTILKLLPDGTLKIIGGDTKISFLYTDGSNKMTGQLDMNSHNIANVADPNSDGDAINLKYLKDNYLKSADAEDAYVPLTRKVNNKQLNADISLIPDDIGAARKSIILSAIILPDKWANTSIPYTQKINISDVKADSIVEISMPDTATEEEIKQFQYLNLTDGGQGNGYIELKSWGIKNTVDITISVVIRGDFY